MGKVSNILKTKGNVIWSVTPDTIVYNAIELMCEKKCQCPSGNKKREACWYLYRKGLCT